MSGRNFSRARDRERMRRRGIEEMRTLPGMRAPLLRGQPTAPRPPAPSKADLRAQGEQAMAQWRARQARDGK